MSITLLFAHIQIHQIVYIKYLQFLVYKFYFNKALKK
jgi:hypothetical protein